MFYSARPTLRGPSKSKKMRCVEHVEQMGKKTTAYYVLMNKTEGTDHFEGMDVG